VSQVICYQFNPIVSPPTIHDVPSKEIPKAVAKRARVGPPTKSTASNVIISCPKEICRSKGTIVNPIVNNFGEVKPVPQLTFTVHTDPPQDGDGPDTQRMDVNVFTDDAIIGAVIAVLLSKPAKIDGPVGIARGPVFSSHPMTLTDTEGRPLPNGIIVPIDSPAAFLPGEQLIISLLTTRGAEVQKVFNVVPH
jgi:hypothetical protein